MLKKLLLAVVVVGISVLTAACGFSEQDTLPKEKARLKIVTSFYPMYIETINITRGVPGVEVLNMTKPQTGCLHDYQLVPEDLKTLETADVFVINGAGMENFLDKVIKQNAQLKVIEASKDISLLMEGAHEHNSEHKHTHEEVANPHVWVSVSNAILQVQNIGAQMAVLDPEYAEQYQKNTAAYVQKLVALKTEMHEELANITAKDIITFHEAFPYFAREFDLNLVAVIEREPGSEPTPQELKATIEKVKALKVKALFTEPQYSAKSAQALSEATGAKVYVLDPAVTGDATKDSYDDYLVIMKKNAKTLKEALQ
ncbi:MAG TPA: zinc ABC transporter substrate-binding protein [Candidatus Avacidaminococcus intestinavium]|uniref:Zinc ABC transporter substrate-binding protein n=1 Tax=Candidatus Avacidaminococcus intestinavium TaxID=2840684 RepID=A0A9D1MQB5_9FIRM|nr:zinc ABC transporter substrate-binding protein [Candidatus Avacidaminococcus intestinavium]